MQVEKVVRDYKSALQSQDYAGALRLTSATFRGKMSATALKESSQAAYKPLIDATTLRFDPVELRPAKKSALLHAQFAADSKQYRANIRLTQDNSTWLISDVTAPVSHQTLANSSGHTSKR